MLKNTYRALIHLVSSSLPHLSDKVLKQISQLQDIKAGYVVYHQIDEYHQNIQGVPPLIVTEGATELSMDQLRTRAISELHRRSQLVGTGEATGN